VYEPFVENVEGLTYFRDEVRPAVRTQMTEHYIAEAGLTEQVQRAAWQIAYGHDHALSK
jgi:hypothetical protein